jgi:AmmeMemoRadiSam system protein B
MKVRPAAVAGMFYPGNPQVLAGQVRQLLGDVESMPTPKALIVPHAGYVYSGAIAGLGYAAVRGAPIEQVVLLGPCHRYGIAGLALPDAAALATPLGEVEVWTAGASIVSGLPQVVVSAAAHAQEHSLEVQLPFLQTVLPGVPVLPLAVGHTRPGEVAEVLDAVWGGPQTLIVVSSDLSHYLAYEQAQRRDAASIDQILRLDGPLSYDQACGADPVNGLLVAAATHGLSAQLYGACNSGDTAGDRHRVVGYSAFGFFDGESGSSFRDMPTASVREPASSGEVRFDLEPEA